MATPILYGHPFSSYTQKALIAFYEKDAPFDFRMLGPDQPETMAALTALWPLGKFPVLSDGPLTLVEASVIVEHVDRAHPGGAPLIPKDDPALEMRMLDRVFDNYVMTPTSKIVGDSLRPADGKDPAGVAEAEATLETIYGWLDGRLAGREWATGGGFTLADCAAAPSLFYADWVYRIDGRYATLSAYRARLLARPSVARVVEEARPYRAYFPLGAPDRD
jgi:glutathione S-transferase